MAVFNSKPVTVNIPTETLFAKFDDLTQLQTLLDKLPDDAKAKIGSVAFDKDSISIQTQQVGEIKFVVKERIHPNKIVFGTESSPVPLILTAILKPIDTQSTEITAQTDVQIPAFLKPMIGGMMQKATDQFSSLIGQLAQAGE